MDRGQNHGLYTCREYRIMIILQDMLQLAQETLGYNVRNQLLCIGLINHVNLIKYWNQSTTYRQNVKYVAVDNNSYNLGPIGFTAVKTTVSTLQEL